MPTIYIDNRPYIVPGGLNLLDACLSLGFNIPYFCWHPAMGSVGACRQCAVKVFRDEHDKTGRIMMSCMTPAADGTRLSIEDEDVRRFRAGVIEMLMANHPHDCPVCDEGGECHLQDMTVMTGHTYRRYRFPKRTYRNQYLGPLVNHEMNRCIQCYRCVRFYRDFAGGGDLDVYAAHNHVYFGRQEDGVLENEFSGNLVEVCPTGVFTDKTAQRHYTRPWDLQMAPSICVHCGLGCNTIPGERYGELRRIRNRYSGQVNGYFLCDRGRYGYEFVNHQGRIRHAPNDAVARIKEMMASGRTIGIGSPRASLESNFALRTLVGRDNFYSGMSQREHELVHLALDMLRNGPSRSPSLRDLESADAMLILGEDLTNTAPMAALSIRLWMRHRPTPEQERLKIPLWNAGALGEVHHEQCSLYIATTRATKLDEAAAEFYRGTPDNIARLGYAVAHMLDASAPDVDAPAALRELAERITAALRGAKRPFIVSGVSSGSRAVMEAAARVAHALPDAALSLCVPECDSMGAAWLGGRSISDVMKSGAHTAIILENDLYRRAPKEDVDKFLDMCANVVVLDHLETDTARRATLALPSGTFAESDGTLINSEGRAQRFYQVFVPHDDIRESWRWIGEIAGQPWRNLDEIAAAMIDAVEGLSPVRDVAPPATYRVAGMKIAREPHRYSGRTAISADITVHEPKPPLDVDSPLNFSMEGYQGDVPPALIPFFWAPGWNSPQAVNKYQQEIGGPLRGGDPGVRLIEPRPDAPRLSAAPHLEEVPAGHLLAAPLHHIFGSEELSSLAIGIAELAPQPYAVLHPEDAAAAGLAEGAQISIIFADREVVLPLTIDAGLAQGVVGLPVSLPGMPWLELPAWVRISGGAPA
jgi:NADH-quinone oxidoreductase subunit G